MFTQILLDEKFLFQKFFLFLRVFFINVASFIIVRYGFISLTDSHKVSYLVSGIGRSKVDKNLWRVNRDQELYIYQTHSGTICLTSLAESTPITFAISFIWSIRFIIGCQCGLKRSRVKPRIGLAKLLSWIVSHLDRSWGKLCPKKVAISTGSNVRRLIGFGSAVAIIVVYKDCLLGYWKLNNALEGEVFSSSFLLLSIIVVCHS